jgi:hypothetical protein
MTSSDLNGQAMPLFLTWHKAQRTDRSSGGVTNTALIRPKHMSVRSALNAPRTNSKNQSRTSVWRKEHLPAAQATHVSANGSCGGVLQAREDPICRTARLRVL